MKKISVLVTSALMLAGAISAAAAQDQHRCFTAIQARMGCL
jgi:hypothetical protein